MAKCPICGRDRDDKKAEEKIRLFCKENGLLSENVNPGGRTLSFPFGKINLTDQCFWCDYDKLREKN